MTPTSRSSRPPEGEGEGEEEEDRNRSSSKMSASDNVNGCRVRLAVQTGTNRLRFTVSFGSGRSAGSGGSTGLGRAALLAAIALNVLGLLYAQLSLTALMLIASIFIALTILWLTHSVQSESILVVPGVGIQCSVKYVRGQDEEFIPWSTINDVIINEVVHLLYLFSNLIFSCYTPYFQNRVLYYLTVLVQDSGETKLIPLFKYTKPRLRMLENIYVEIQNLLQTQSLDQGKDGSGDI